MLPGLFFVLVFVVWPLIRGIQMSMFNWNLMVPSRSTFVGADNLIRALTDPDFWVDRKSVG